MWEIKIQIKKFRGFVKIFIRFFIHKVSCEVTKRSGALNSREELGDSTWHPRRFKEMPPFNILRRFKKNQRVLFS